ncbi:MAG: UbiA family prenyltransferase [Candidatus Moranbacteria bacterium]|nr:UbiA family prenyltransferase [Candidatus Moranbacteria bacterium]
MKKFLDIAGSLLTEIENSKTNLSIWIISFLALISIRLLIIRFLTESWAKVPLAKKDLWFFYEFSHTFLFFLITYLLFLIILKKLLKLSIKKVSNILLFGYIIILTPPVTDHIISKGKGFWSFYEFDNLYGLLIRFFTFFGSTPESGMTYGVRIGVAISLLFIFIYGYAKTKKVLASLKLLLVSYVIFFILGTLPSWIAILVQGASKGFLSVDAIDTAQMFLSPPSIFSREVGDTLSAISVKMSLVLTPVLIPTILLSFYSEYFEKIKLFMKNIRVAQIFLHVGMLLTGIGLAMIFSPSDWDLNFFNALAILIAIQAVVLSWITSIVVNDIFDQKIDEISNSSRPLVLKKFSVVEYQVIGIVSFVLAILSAYTISTKVALFLVVYQSLAWLYSAAPFRLKKFTVISTFISSVALIIIMFCGFILVSPTQTITNLPQSIILLLLISLTISLPVKDLKDIKGDAKDKIRTIPVVFGEYWGKVIIASGIFLSFILSVFFLNEFQLLWWAALFGGISFWVVLYSNQNKYITHRNINWWLLSILFAYTVILIFTVFV